MPAAPHGHALAIPWHQRLEARVLLGLTVIAGLSLLTVALVTSSVVRRHAFERARTDLSSARTAFTMLITTRADTADREAGLVAELPTLLSHLTDSELTADRNTMDEVTRRYCGLLDATFCIVTAADARWLASPDAPAGASSNETVAGLVRSASEGHPARSIGVLGDALYLVVARPALFADEVLGSFTSAYRLDDDMAHQLAGVTRSQVGLVVGGSLSGSSLTGAQRRDFERLATRGLPETGGDVSWITVGDARFIGGTSPLTVDGSEVESGRLVLLRAWAPSEQFIGDILRQLTWAGAVVFAFALMGSVALSRRMSRPLRQIADGAAEVAAGKWTKRLPVNGSAEAVAMARAFNAMTDSLSHWHAEARQRAEQLQAAYERYAAITDSAPDAIVSAGAGTGLVFWSRSAALVFGYDEAEALTLTLPDLFTASSATVGAEMLDAGVGEGDAAPSPRRFEAEGRRKDGSVFPCELTVSSWRAGDARFVTAIVRDVTERRRTEDALRQRDAQLVHAQKMEAIGRLASGVAHDFNNALAVIQGYTEQMIVCLGPSHEHYEDLNEVLKATGSATSLTRQLLAFSRKQPADPQVISVGDTFAHIHRMLQRLVGTDVDLVFVPSEERDDILADRGQIEQVLINLCVNARDAMQSGGSLHLSIRTTRLADPSTCARLRVPAGTYVTLTVRDTGHGMDAETAARVFEPFFTTKGEGKGTGLGLALVFSIVEQSHGAIELVTAPGQGTTFHVHLPLAGEAAVASAGAQDEALPRGTGRVLLVEDEDPVRKVVQRTLDAAGYDVLTAASAADALAILRQDPGDVDVLLTDVLMPGMDGAALAQIVSAERPHTRVLFMSGHPKDAFTQVGMDPQSVRLLRKPFSAAALCRELRDVLS